MSNNESFIDEVTEEVRRDKLFAAFRKYGWIGVLLVVAVVGGTAYSEWNKAQSKAKAEAFGDAVIEALDLGGVEARREALAAIDAEDSQKAILNLIMASDPQEDREATLAALSALEADGSQPQVYRDLATLRRVLVSSSDMSIEDRRTALQAIAAPGRAFRPLAEEQLAYLLVEEGKTEEALTALRALTEDQAAPQSLRARVGQMIMVLGGAPAPASAANGG